MIWFSILLLVLSAVGLLVLVSLMVLEGASRAGSSRAKRLLDKVLRV